MENGDVDGMAASKTAEIHGAANQWEGTVCFNDNHAVHVDTFTPEGMAAGGTGAAAVFDNLFKEDSSDRTDCFLTITPEAPSPARHTYKWD